MFHCKFLLQREVKKLIRTLLYHVWVGKVHVISRRRHKKSTRCFLQYGNLKRERRRTCRPRKAMIEGTVPDEAVLLGNEQKQDALVSPLTLLTSSFAHKNSLP